MRLTKLLLLLLLFPYSAFAYVAGPDPIANADGSCKEAIVAVAGCFQLNGVYELNLWADIGEARRITFTAREGKQVLGAEGDVKIRVKEVGNRWVMLITYESSGISFAQLNRVNENSTNHLFESVPNCGEAREPSVWRDYFTGYLQQIRDYD